MQDLFALQTDFVWIRIFRVKFVKAQATGNDFIIIDLLEGKSVDIPNFARKFCQRRYGIGADGVLVLENSDIADFKMRIFNADGSEAEMCGNGIRCLAEYVRIRYGKTSVKFETLAGVKEVRREGELFSVDMGAGKVIGEDMVKIGGGKVEFVRVDVGNPHAVVFDLEKFSLAPEIEMAYPGRTNVEFVEVVGEKAQVRVWERGVGETLACGTGACAILLAVKFKGSNVKAVEFRGGTVEVEERGGRLYLKGPAELVFEGECFGI